MTKKKTVEKEADKNQLMGVYTIKQAHSEKGKFIKEKAVVVRNAACITHAAAEQMNFYFEKGFNGRFCVLNEKANKQYLESVKPKSDIK